MCHKYLVCAGMFICLSANEKHTLEQLRIFGVFLRGCTKTTPSACARIPLKNNQTVDEMFSQNRHFYWYSSGIVSCEAGRTAIVARNNAHTRRQYANRVAGFS